MWWLEFDYDDSTAERTQIFSIRRQAYACFSCRLHSATSGRLGSAEGWGQVCHSDMGSSLVPGPGRDNELLVELVSGYETCP